MTDNYKTILNSIIAIHLKKKVLYVIPVYIIFILPEEFLIEDNEISDFELIDKFSQFFLIIFYLIEKYRSSSYTINQVIKMKKEFFYIIFIIILLIFILESIQIKINYFYMKYENYDKTYYIKGANNIFFMCLIEIYFFEKQIYSHHILSIIITFLMFLIYIPINRPFKNHLYFFCCLIEEYCFSYNLLLIKNLNVKYFISIYLLASIFGLYDFCFSLYYSSFEFTKIFNYKYFLFFLIYCIYNLIYFYQVKEFGAVYSRMYESFSYFIVMVVLVIFEFEKQEIEYIIFIFVLTILALIYRNY